MPHAQSPERDTSNFDEDVPSFNGQKLYVNDGLLRPDQVGQLKESSPEMPIEELRRRYNEDGYVFLKGLLPREDVLKAREQYFAMLAPTGVLKPGTQPVEGIFDPEKDAADFPGFGAGAAGSNGRPGPSTAEMFVDLALKAHYADWYKEKFAKHPVLKDFIAKISGWDEHTLAIKRSLLRNNTPGNKAIGVHYDQIFLRYGEPTSYTAWVPMGDISLTDNWILLTQRSCHTLGRKIEAEFTQKARESGLSEAETRNAFNQNMQSNGLLADGPREYSDIHKQRWLVTEYEAGDVVLHTPFTIHASTINLDSIIRLGTDLRFVDSSKPWDKRWDKNYDFNDGV
ncbi:hypothetical protein P153DRAFT_403715 [Dothidotthia symphoricarpi CBS 119687]|uniref:Phytanoyl-CoA hydroxylase n=1 Tax=Dothidotthia symphoricarpi CBS 119687 TaxID=1392245 RepID=A0A6A6AA69_9PLEO|nr:uncharacterized protein P153DRAFT_403715 [Dothidotthia symphoricarpi CBS 119687]KAF2128822.1 hypothetical protein P153DRAFT_403715 [Dothidotthia symphoricarpi CBS 119687]